MSIVKQYRVEVTFGDCDPAGIVFFPNFSRWMDAASLHYFVQSGVPSWNQLLKTDGIIGTPLLEIHTRFVNSATFGEQLLIETSIEVWHSKAFVQKHRITRGEDLICEGEETRIFVIRNAETGRLKSIAVPQDIKEKCGG